MKATSTEADVRAQSPGSLFTLAILLVLTAFIYWPGLSGDLVLDDTSTLEPISRLARGEISLYETLFQQDHFRPVSMASYVLNWLTTGDQIWPLKFTNLIIHLLCGVLVYFLSDRLLSRPVAAITERRHWVALWITACWLLAPLLVSTVLYVTQRMAALATLWSLAALLAYLCGRDVLEQNRLRGLGLIALGFGLFWPLAILSKENSVIVPVLIVVIEIFFRQAQANTAKPLIRWSLALPIVLSIIIALAFIIAQPKSILFGYEFRSFTLWERVLTEWRILFDYLANLILIPGSSPFGIYHDDYPISKSLFDPITTLISALAWLTVLALGWRTRGTPAGLLAFGLWFYLAAHGVESTILPLELYFEHRNYLPSIGLYFSLGYGGYLLATRFQLKRLIISVLILVPICYGAISIQRIWVWQSWDRMLFAALSHSPDSTRVHTGLANLYLNQGNPDLALKHLDIAGKNSDAAQFGLILHTLGIHCRTQRLPEIQIYNRLQQSTPTDDVYSVNALGWLANAVTRGECGSIDVQRLAMTLHKAMKDQTQEGLHGNHWLIHFHTAKLLAASDNKFNALVHLDIAWKLAPKHLEAGLLAVRYRLDLKAYSDAENTLSKVQQRDTGRVTRHTQLIEEFQRRLKHASKAN